LLASHILRVTLHKIAFYKPTDPIVQGKANKKIIINGSKKAIYFYHEKKKDKKKWAGSPGLKKNIKKKI
jgi:hypothetical protein